MSTKLAATPLRAQPLPQRQRPTTHAPIRLTTLALLSLILAACLPGDDTSTSRTDTPGGQLDPQPTTGALVLDPRIAREHERNGEYEEAIAIFRAIVEQEDGSDQANARLSLSRLYIRLDRYDLARQQLETYLDGAPSGADARAARFLLARSLAGLGEFQAALGMYDQYLDAGGFASPYARLARADLLSSLGRPQEAAREAEAALAGALPDSVRLSALLTIAQSYEQAGESDEATRWYATLSEESPFAADKALALWRTADLKRAAADPTWKDDLAVVLSAYPETNAAEGALADLLEAGEAVDLFSQGMVYYRNFRNAEARQAFSDYLDQQPTGPRAGAAAFYLAATEERLFEPLAALSHYQDSLRLQPSGPLADDALWWRGRILEQLSRLDEARTAYQTLRSLHPSSPWAPPAAFRAALVLYRQGRYADAAQTWADSASPSPEPRTRLWLAKAYVASGDHDLAAAELEALARDLPNEYYGVRAAALLQGDDDLEEGASTDAPSLPDGDRTTDWASADAWIAPFAPPPFSLSRLLILSPDQRWLRGRELLDLGLASEATAEFRAVIDAYEEEPYALYDLARDLDALTLTHAAAEAATRLLDVLPDEAAAGAPPEVLRLAYPVDYTDLIETAAGSEQVSPLLVLALIRQESFFDPDAGSSAGALGLTQVIPSTGRDIARSLGRAQFDPDDLYRPSVSIPFGAHYLSQQLTAFDGNLHQALAAYNAGPGNAARWRERTGDDPDLFLEAVEFEETRGYITRVVENVARYHRLYAAP